MAAGAVLALVSSHCPARAWWFEDDGHSWPVFAFHEYDGSDVNRTGGTPDRPYWHGDDAVPAGLRWRDLEAAQEAEAVELQAGAAVEVAPLSPAPVRHTRVVRRHRTVSRHLPRICVPAPVASR